MNGINPPTFSVVVYFSANLFDDKMEIMQLNLETSFSDLLKHYNLVQIKSMLRISVISVNKFYSEYSVWVWHGRWVRTEEPETYSVEPNTWASYFGSSK